MATSPSTRTPDTAAIEDHLHAEAPRHLVAQRVGEVGVELHQQPLARVDQRHAHAERREDPGVLAPDHAAADHDEPAGDLGQRQDVVAVHHDPAVERDVRRVGRPRAGREQEDVRGDPALRLLVPRDLDGMRVHEAGRALDLGDAVLLEVLLDHLPRLLHDGPLAMHEVADRDVRLDPILHAVEAALAEAAQVERGLAEGLGRDGARVDGGATRLGGALDDADGLPEIRDLRGPLLARGAAADDAEIEVLSHGAQK